jgi:hypothetical protein
MQIRDIAQNISSTTEKTTETKQTVSAYICTPCSYWTNHTGESNNLL